MTDILGLDYNSYFCIKGRLPILGSLPFLYNNFR